MMDPDAAPLVKADALASQGEQLSSKRAYQQAVTAHTDAAHNYQLAAQATSDTGAAKALLLQRDRQLKAAQEAQRQLERGRGSRPAGGSQASSSNSAKTAIKSNTNGVHHQHAQSTASPSAHALQFRERGLPGQLPVSGITAGLHQQHLHGLGPARFSQPPHAGSTYTSPRDRIETSSLMNESRYSRKSNSPSTSQIAVGGHVIPATSSGESAKASSSVEESYYLMRNENDPADPVSTFLANVENMVAELGNAVAFASAPLHIGPPGYAQPMPTATSSPRKPSKPKESDIAKNATPEMTTTGILESFYVVPTVNKPGQSATSSLKADNSSTAQTDNPGSAIYKTHEELVEENATLKSTLDQLTRRLEWLTKERQREKESLKDSVTLFARDVRRQAERLGQSTAALPDARRQMAPPSFYNHHQPAAGHAGSDEAQQRKINALQEELRHAKAEAEKHAANAQRYKTRYDDLRKAILEKRKAKEMAANAGTSPGKIDAASDAHSMNT